MQDGNPAVELEDVDFCWGTADSLNHQRFRLAGINLVVERGEKLFLEGASGSGKSTLLGLIAGTLLPVNDGMIRLLGTDLVTIGSAGRDSFRAEHIGMVFQIFNLVPYLSAVENIVLPLHFAANRKKRVLEGAESLESEAVSLMHRLGLPADQLYDRKPSELSVGQQQRVAVARALIGSPEVIIADEPTSALDKANQNEFLDLLFEQVESSASTLIMVSHDERIAERFERSLTMREVMGEKLTEAIS